jgi:hypothetical protein
VFAEEFNERPNFGKVMQVLAVLAQEAAKNSELRKQNDNG